jgi:hypothetical protein
MRAMILMEQAALRSASRHSRAATCSSAGDIAGRRLTRCAEECGSTAGKAAVVAGGPAREAEGPRARRRLVMVGKGACAFSETHRAARCHWDGAGRSITRNSRRPRAR